MIGKDELITSFIQSLVRDGASSKTQKSYAADLKDFFLWLTTCLEFQGTFDLQKTVQNLESKDIKAYLENLVAENKSIATMNRRLSTLRAFFTFTNSSGFTRINPTQGIPNVLAEIASEDLAITEALSYWNTHLNHKGLDIESVSKRMDLVKDFLTWKKAHKAY